MTKEETIEVLSRPLHMKSTPQDVLDAHKMAIKTLEQESCDDCVSRKAVLETINNRIEQIKRDANEINKSYSHLSFAEGVHDGYCRLKCDMRILPSVNPQEQKIGHWLKYKHMIYCSECGASIEAGYLNDMNYCYDCGTKMESEE